MHRGSRETHRRRALTAAELITFLLIALITLAIFSIFFPWGFGRDRRMSPGLICAANLKGIGNGLATYAEANNDFWPIPAHMAAEADDVGRVTYAPHQIGTKRGNRWQPDAGRSTDQDAALSTTRAFWELIRAGSASPKSFVCPASKDLHDEEEDPHEFWDFRNYCEISYGYQVPFGKRGRPRMNVDPDMALAADKGPFGAALETGWPDPGSPKANRNSIPQDWKPWNSPNHGGEGQNVLYSDAHVEFVTTPLAGWKKDNIYTRWSQPDADRDENELARIQGTPPTGIETPWGDTDSLIYP